VIVNTAISSTESLCYAQALQFGHFQGPKAAFDPAQAWRFPDRRDFLLEAAMV
jgi:hypothetical protein